MSCHDYGISSGCDLDCPHLWSGTCYVAEEVIEQYLEDLSSDELEELNDIYGLKEDKPKYTSIW